MQVNTIDMAIPEDQGLETILTVLGLSGLSISELDLEDVRLSREALSGIADATVEGNAEFGEQYSLNEDDIDEMVRIGVQKTVFVEETGDLLIQTVILAESQVLFIPNKLWTLTSATLH